MEQKEILLSKLEIEKDHIKNKALKNIVTIRRMLNDIEKKVLLDEITTNDNFQDSECLLYRDLAKLEQLNEFINELKNY